MVKVKNKMKKLNFGCGTDIRKGWDNCDIQKNKEVIYCDMNIFPYPFKDDTYEYILFYGCLHYSYCPDKVIDELRRISKNNGVIDITIPYYNNKGAVTAMETKSFFSDKTFVYHVEKKFYYEFDKTRQFEILTLELTPTKVGKFLPKFIREKLSCMIGGLIADVNVKLKVINK